MKMTASSSGSGRITVKQLRELLDAKDIPDEAEVNFHSSDSQRDGPYWSFSATWGENPSPLGLQQRSNIGDSFRQQLDDQRRLQQSQFGDH